MKRDRPRVAVLGSINLDLVLPCAAMPRPGETVFADTVHEVCGGKGANQAVAAARAGADVSMIGRVGDDAFAERLLDNLVQAGVDVSGVRRTAEVASGLAVIVVEPDGQNSILVVAGANGQVTAEDVTAARTPIEQSDVLLVQLEIPYEAVRAGIRIAREANVRVILDPAPAPRPDELTADLLQVDVLCPNQSEAAALVGFPVETQSDAEQAVRELHRRGVQHAVITLGGAGVLLGDGADMRHLSACPVQAIDTTAAGDAFAGALGTHWAETGELSAAIRFANAAGALAAATFGAQPSLPHRAQIEKLLQTSGTQP